MSKNAESPRFPALSPRARGVLAATTFSLFLIQSLHTLLGWTYAWDYHGVRLARAFVLRAGEPLFPGVGGGAVSTPIYGPISAFLYLPAAWAQRPATALVIAQTLAALAFFLPVVWLLYRFAPRFQAALDALLLFAAATFAVPALNYVAFNVHTDAPAVGLSLLAGAAIFARRPRAAAICCVLALWTKQMTLPLAPALLVWTWFRRSRNDALRLFGELAAWGLVSLVLMIVFFGPAENLWFNLWTIPAGHTLVLESGLLDAAARASKAFVANVFTGFMLWIVAAALTRRREILYLFGWIALCQIPLAVLGFLKKAGDINAYAYVTYFLAAGAVFALASDETETHDPVRLRLRRLVAAIPIVFFATSALFSLLSPEPWPRRFDPNRVPAEIAFDYMQEHPGELYFPRLTWVSAMAEGEIYHQGIGVMDRALGGVPVTGDELRAFLPKNMRGVAMAHNGFENEIVFLAELRLSCPTVIPELPAFDVWQIDALDEEDGPFTVDAGLCGRAIEPSPEGTP